MKFAVLLASLLALSIVLARSAEIATPDDTARFLAGLQPAQGSPLTVLTKDPSWQRHATFFNAIFQEVDKTHLSKIRAFSKTQLTTTHDTMLYMFGGPDALHAIAFFPDATTYVLSGLEPIGDVPQLTSMPNSTIARSLRNLEAAMNPLLTISFFRTKDMKTQLQSGSVNGVLPIIYVFLARSGKTVHDTSFVSLDKDGNIIPPNATGVKAAAKGVKIVFTAGEGREQTLYYFSTNLANEGVKTSGFLAFCDKLGIADGFVKSASYLMHQNDFSMVRSFLLDHSATILQDDTGIPVSYLDRKTWQLHPFGHYAALVQAFTRNYYQPQLAELFRKGQPTPLDFGLGYHWRVNESSLLLAEKIAGRKPD